MTRSGLLQGLRILDLTRLLPGPWCTLLLGDLGADVVKIERPGGGDNSRAAKPRYEGGSRSESVYFCTVNRNKRSLVLDLKEDEGRSAFLDLARAADVVVESFRPGVADRLGIGYAALKALNPKMIYCALSGYGQTGPLSRLAGHDLNIAGLSGLLQFSPDQTPAMPGILMGDYAGGAMAVIAILAAVSGRDRSGEGAFLDVSMLDALIGWTGIQMNNAFARAAGSSGDSIEGWGGNPRYGIYRTKDDRYLTVSLLEKHFWVAFCNHIGRPELIDPDEDETDRLSSHGERGALYRKALTETFITKDRDIWAAEMRAQRIPICAVLTPEEVYRAAPDGNRDWFIRQNVPGFDNPLPQMGFPFRMELASGDSGFALRRPPPELGEANAEFDRTGSIWSD